MRILDYGIAAIIEGIFFLGVAGLIGAGIAQMINRRPRPRNVLYRVDGPIGTQLRTTPATHIDQWRSKPDTSSNYRTPRFGFWERLRAMYYDYQIDRLAHAIEKKLERKQRRAEAAWMRHLGE
jgi:hypothetical protein